MSNLANPDAGSVELDDYRGLSNQQVALLLISIALVALCGISYELIIGAVSSYLLGNSVYQFSLTIGFFMFAMGVGSLISKIFIRNLLAGFVWIEIIISIIGGLCSLSLFLVFSGVYALYTPSMYLFIIVIGILVGLEIPLLTRILTQKDIIRNSIANVLSLDYIGALIGSIIFPLLLLPQLGLIRASFVIGLINILTALVNVVYFRRILERSKLLMLASFVTLIVLCLLVIFGSQLTSYAEHHLYRDQVVFDKQTPYQKLIFTQDPTGSHRMYIDGHIQFSQRDEYRYHEALVYPVMSLPGPKQHILILGGGDGLAARDVLKFEQVETIDLVDIDPEVTGFSATFPALRKLNGNSLGNKKVTIHNVDAFSFIGQSNKLFDCVIIDMPDPHNEALNKLYSREFYQMIKSHMTPQAVLVTQSSSPFFARRTYWSIAATLESAGFDVYSYHITVPSFGLWGFHLAANYPVASDQFAIPGQTRFISNEVMQAAHVFSPDIARLEVPINTMLQPNLYTLYVEDIRH